MILLARTDPDAPKHKGISYFLLDMKSPGITVRPLPNMAGRVDFNEEFFDNVRIPRDNLVGGENRGWYAETTTLDFDGSGIASGVSHTLTVEAFIEYARQQSQDPGCAAARDPLLRYQLADRAIEAQIERMLNLHVVSIQARRI